MWRFPGAPASVVSTAGAVGLIVCDALGIKRLNPAHPSAFRKSLQLLWTQRFGTFWFASLLSSIGTWAQLVAQPWLLLSLGASSFLLGLDTFAMGAPVFLLTLVGGALADRADRRRVIGLFQSIQMLCPLLVVILLLSGAARAWMVIALSLVIGITDALSMPSYQTIVATIVRKDEIPTGIALNSTQFNLSRILGPAVAGVLMASIGAIGAFAVSAASYLPFILVALWILPRSQGGAVGRMHYADLVRDVRTIAHDPVLRGALLTVLATSLLCAPLVTFCPVLVQKVFHGDVTHFSIAMGAFGIGGLIGAVALLGVDTGRDRRPLASWTGILYGAMVLFAALDPWLGALPVLLAAAGVVMTMSSASANAVLQMAAARELRGQSVGLFMLAMRGGTAVGGLVSGVSVELLGVREALCINGVLAMIVQLALARRWLAAPQRAA